MKDMKSGYELTDFRKWVALPSPPVLEEGLPVMVFAHENKIMDGQVVGLVDYEDEVIKISTQTVRNSDASAQPHFRKLWMATALPQEVWADTQDGEAMLQYLARFEDGYFGVTVLDGEALWFYWDADGSVLQDKRRGVLLYQAKVESAK